MRVSVEDKALIFSHFPKLRKSKHKFTSPIDYRYNCIAWSVGDNTRCWWPDNSLYWPEELPIDDSLNSFIQMYSSLGFRLTELIPEIGVDAVAIYGIGETVKHAARRLSATGQWTSKLGSQFDIEHTLNAIESKEYGDLLALMSR